MYVPRRVFREIWDMISEETQILNNQNAKTLASVPFPQMAARLKTNTQVCEDRILKQLQIILCNEPEGPGDIAILTANGSNNHRGLYKVSAIVEGAIPHRINRMENELLTPIDTAYTRRFEHRLHAEEQVHHRAILFRHQKSGSKWFRASSPNDLIKIIESVKE